MGFKILLNFLLTKTFYNMDNFLNTQYNTGLSITMKNGDYFEISSDKQNPLDDITLSEGILSVDDTDFKVSISEVKSIECWDNDQQMDDMAYIEFV